ncbi:MAG: hypothetical protein JW991_04255 [Candidatus Pacebacteria bacterium]|nr:hypothetical protein [Candidatus Paceibacterota bacterium]
MKSRFKTFLCLSLLGLVFFLIVFRFAGKDQLILGGEGNYFLNLSQTRKIQGFAWSIRNRGTGQISRLPHAIFLYADFFAFWQRLNLQLATVINAFLVYYLPFLAFFILAKKGLGLDLGTALIVSLFYILNPSSVDYLASLALWQTSILFILPVFFFLIYRYFYQGKKLFIYFGLFTFLASFGLSNPPLLGIALLSLPLFLIATSLLLKGKLNLKRILGNLLILVLALSLFNFWWLANLFTRRATLQASYTEDFAVSWVQQYQSDNIFTDLFLFRWLVPKDPAYNFLASFYRCPAMGLFLLWPFAFILISFLRLNKKRLALTVLFLFLLLILALTAGAGGPLGPIFLFLMKKIPLFIMFKTHREKFGVLFIFLVALVSGLLLGFENKRRGKLFKLVFAGYLLVCAIPFISGNFIPESKIEKDKFTSRRFVYKKEYQEMIQAVNNQPELFRVLSFPGSENYQVTMHSRDDRYYRGMDPLMYGLTKPFIAAYRKNPFDRFLFTRVTDAGWQKALSFYNIGRVFLNLDLYPSFGFIESRGPAELNDLFTRRFDCLKNQSIVLCKNDESLPLFYLPHKQTHTNGDQEFLLDLVSLPDFEQPIAVYLKNGQQGPPEIIDWADEFLVKGRLIGSLGEEDLALAGQPVQLPFVRQKPGTVWHRLVLKKEQLDKQAAGDDSEVLFEKYLFYAGKRLNETISFKVDQSGAYREEMSAAIRILEYIRGVGSKNLPSLWAKLRARLGEHERIVNEFFPEGEIRINFDNFFEKLAGEFKSLRQEPDFSRLSYEFEIPQGGNYSLLISQKTIKEGQIAKTWSDLGEKYFAPGSQSLVLPIDNLYQHQLGQNLEIEDYRPDAVYRLWFEYRQSGYPVSFYLTEPDLGNTLKKNLPMTGSEWRSYEIFFRSSPWAEEAVIQLPVEEKRNLKVERIYRPDLVLKRTLPVSTESAPPRITFTRVNPTKYRIKVQGAKNPYSLVFLESFHPEWQVFLSDSGQVGGGDFPVIARYFDGQVSEGRHQDLGFDRSLGETWGKPPLAAGRHFLINGYANAWRIKPEDVGGQEDYGLIVEFTGQRALYRGWLVSLGTIAVSLLVLVVGWFKSFKKVTKAL